MKSTIMPKLNFELYITLTEEEARAFEAITLYGTNSFLNTFYNTLGKTYLQPHENELKSLFDNVHNKLSQDLKKIDETKKNWSEK